MHSVSCIAARHYHHHSESDRNNVRYSLWRTISGLWILPLLRLLETESVIWPCICGTLIYIMRIEDDLLLSFHTATEKSTPCNLVVSRLHSNPSPTLKLTFLLLKACCAFFLFLLVWTVPMKGITKARKILVQAPQRGMANVPQMHTSHGCPKREGEMRNLCDYWIFCGALPIGRLATNW
jgi:hypothetical protein